MTNFPFTSIDQFRDIESLNHYREAVAGGQDPAAVLKTMLGPSRDNARTPMQWDNSSNAGFSTGTPWLPINPNYPQVNAAAALADPDSVLHHYRKLIALRHAEPAVADGDFTMLLQNDEQIYAFTRRLGSTQLLVLANLSGEPADSGVLPEWTGADTVLTNVPDGGQQVLQPWEARILRRVMSD